MSFPRAAVFLWVASTRNRLIHQARRLRQPKYLVGAAVGALYVYSFLLRRLSYLDAGEAVPPLARHFAQALLMAAALGTLLSAWALGPDRPALSFSETEVQQFFPAPVSRRHLLHFKLLRGLVGAGAGALFATVFTSRVLSPQPAFFFVGTFLSLTTVSLHTTAASFTRTRLARWGRWGSVLRWGVLTAVFAVLVGAVLAGLEAHPFPAETRERGELRAWLLTWLDSPVLWPGRVLLAVAFAEEGASFARRLPLALGLLGLHYTWVMTSAVPFEEAAVVRAEERARRREQLARRGGAAPARVGRQPFRLSARGRPEVALLWKNLVAGRRLGGPGRLVAAGVVGGVVAAVASGEGPAEILGHLRLFLAPLCAGIAVMLCVFGPSSVRVDLRMDLPRLEQLRALPLTGRQVVAAELAAPALLLGGTQIVLLVLAMGLALWRGGPWAETWVAGGLAALCVLPAVTLGGLFVQNAAVVLFPAWLPPEGERARGLEAMGQRLLTLVGTLVVLLVGLVPAAFLAAVVGFALYELGGLDVWALPFAGLSAAAVLVGEVALGIVGLGRAFEQLDVSGEGRGTGT
ncbi:putative ABC exporter domain-containing protein [Archangium primigenium]|uniref:putative ABC exporter domain-containing protein n=1 Tax=[Archangium] primigenium TaxID=2792470 RepID=UPI00195B1604|nr:putative ABC exporter domain-containing protein [Archangium primigenium]MBM7116299.1 ABC transporter permease [Archangium primigenium]